MQRGHLQIHPLAGKVTQLDACKACGGEMVELHTGEYAHATSDADRQAWVDRLRTQARYANKLGLVAAAGHGLDYRNIGALLTIDEIVEYNIGHSIVAHALFVGFERAVREMVALLRQPR